MEKSEIAHHVSMKAKDINYPKLPKFLLTSKKTSQGLQDSCIRGFEGRLANWQRAQDVRTESNLRSLTASTMLYKEEYGE